VKCSEETFVTRELHALGLQLLRSLGERAVTAELGNCRNDIEKFDQGFSTSSRRDDLLASGSVKTSPAFST
jgi:hypothetical protein